LTLSKETSIRMYSLPKEIAAINLHDGCEMEIPTSIAELVKLLDGNTTLRQALKVKISGAVSWEETDDFDDLLVELSSEEAMPIIRRLFEKKVLLKTL
jgi:hypothetical protein